MDRTSNATISSLLLELVSLLTRTMFETALRQRLSEQNYHPTFACTIRDTLMLPRSSTKATSTSPGSQQGSGIRVLA